jgi:hypothetical protein
MNGKTCIIYSLVKALQPLVSVSDKIKLFCGMPLFLQSLTPNNQRIFQSWTSIVFFTGPEAF